MKFLIDNWGNDIFWEELNLGYYQMRDDYLMNQPGFDPYNLSGRDSYYQSVMTARDT